MPFRTPRLALLVAAVPRVVAAQSARLVVPGAPVADSSGAGAPTPAQAERERERLRRRAGYERLAAPPREPVNGARPHPGAPAYLGDAAGGFDVSVQTDAPEYVVWDAEYTEPMWIRIVSRADGYLTLLSGGTGPGLTVLAPNDLVAQLPIRAGQPLDFPLQEWARLGVELRPQLPDGSDLSDQAITAVVTRRPVALPPFDFDRVDPPLPNTISARTFQIWLARIPPAERGVAQAFYLVRRP